MNLKQWKWNKQQLLIVLCVGILLLVIAIPTDDDAQVIRKNGSIEEQLEDILSQIEGAGKIHVMITTDEHENVQGIAVSAQGGNQPIIAKEIVEVIRALFDVETHKIKVIKGGS